MRTLAERITVRPIIVDLKGKDAVPETVHHVYVPIDSSAAAPPASTVQPTTDGALLLWPLLLWPLLLWPLLLWPWLLWPLLLWCCCGYVVVVAQAFTRVT